MAFITKFNKFHKKHLLKNVTTSKVLPVAFVSSEDSSELLPPPDLRCFSNSQLKKNVLKNFCAPSSYTILAGNPQPVDRRDLLRHDITIKKWEQKTNIIPKNNLTILLGITMFAEINKN
ncbi:PREDICTED: uncharacterized protein LOC106117679 [Papilio xuthus]|uniref:Uncharacterized protein LOC106117679 n=1 Tax=Papilio xuthus TaxID=66420 RepID=A0AAJ7E8Y3_PAPXU|nr:PREDICTED: uncharacterized protein LOC106117679 [Papilio xuthus]